jgi:hypothetical protein
MYSFLESTVERRIMPLPAGFTYNATTFDGIVARTRDGADSNKFSRKVQEALDKINSKPVGQQLLNEIVSLAGQVKFAASRANLGYAVGITPRASVKQSTLFGNIRWRNYQPGGSVTFAINEVNASTPGEGSVSVITWDPASNSTPDGSRPPFIGLAHELIHAWHNLGGGSLISTSQGTMGEPFSGAGGGIEAAKNVDEMRVVGLQGWEKEPITENRIRAEHGLPYRNSYEGRCSAQDGTPDETLLAGPADPIAI